MNQTQPIAGEEVQIVLNEHWVKYIFPVFVYTLLFLISALLFYLSAFVAHHYEWLSHITFFAALVLFFIIHHWFFMMLMSEVLDRIIITNRRLIRLQYRMIFHEDVLEIAFRFMKTVDAKKRGPLQIILNYGSLVFEANKASVSLVPHPNRVAEAVQKLMNAQ